MTGGRAHFPPRESLPELHDGDNSPTSGFHLMNYSTHTWHLLHKPLADISNGNLDQPRFHLYTKLRLLAKFVCLRFLFFPMKTAGAVILTITRNFISIPLFRSSLREMKFSFLLRFCGRTMKKVYIIPPSK